MKKPIFFSVGGQKDLFIAKRLKDLLPDKSVYLYTKTGEEGVGIGKEIDLEISSCKIFVVFWSDDYLKSDHCKIELAKFKKYAALDSGIKRDLVIFPCDIDHPDIQKKWTNPITQIEEFVFGKWRDNRSIDSGHDHVRAKEVILKILDTLSPSTDVLIPRGDLIDQLDRATQAEGMKAREVNFVIGLDGHGRRTAVKQLMRSSFPEKIERKITLDPTQEPRDLLLSLMEAMATSDSDRQQLFLNIENGVVSAEKVARELLHSGRSTNSYFTIAFDRNAALDLSLIPEWFYKLLEVFKLGNYPLIFVIAAAGSARESQQYLPESSKLTIPGLEDNEIERLVINLARIDYNPDRWTPHSIKAASKASANNPSLCKLIMRSLSLENSLDFLEEVAKRTENSFAQGMSAILKHIVDNYQDRPAELTALMVIEKIGVTSKKALEEILEPLLNGEEINLYQLREDGLIEQLSDGLLRIPPLIQRRLGSSLWRAVDKSKIDELFESFSKKHLLFTDELGPIFASNLISISARSNTDLPQSLDRYVTIATLFKAGIDSYSEKNYRVSHSILKRTFNLLKEKESADLSTQIEIARYTGLACARQDDSNGMKEACSFLENKFKSTKKHAQAQAMSEFIRGFKARRDKIWSTAIDHLNKALSLIENSRNSNRQRAAILTELCYVNIEKTVPNYEVALALSKRAFESVDVTHTLNAYIRAKILHAFRSTNPVDPMREVGSIREMIEDLAMRSPGKYAGMETERELELQQEIRNWNHR